MIRLVAGRLAGLLATLLLSSFVIFGALYLAPGDPIAFLTGGRTISPEALAALRGETPPGAVVLQLPVRVEVEKTP